jgi:hypothetical protein
MIILLFCFLRTVPLLFRRVSVELGPPTKPLPVFRTEGSILELEGRRQYPGAMYIKETMLRYFEDF